MKRSRLVVRTLLVVLAITASTAALAASKADYKRTVEQYTIPDVTLVNQDGKRVRMLDLINSDKPVVLDFIYGTCTTICPVLSANFTNFQRKLGSGSGSVQLISISIDPEHDTPEIMTKYLKNYRSKPGWDFLTGSRGDIDRVMRAFNAYVPNKMSHYPILFFRAPRGDNWVRIYGLIGTSDFLKEYEKISSRP
jgi:protein SCO1/2